MQGDVHQQLSNYPISAREYKERYNHPVQKRIFWTLVLVLSLLADMVLPLLWGLVAAIPIIYVSWWIVYRSGWF
jgi:uncharacterized membrane protein